MKQIDMKQKCLFFSDIFVQALQNKSYMKHNKSTFIAALALLITPSMVFAKNMTLKSPDVKAGATIALKHVFNGFGCTGENILPSLEWSHAPTDTKSFAITVYDPDAPTGSGWWHWLAFNIPSSVTKISAQNIPAQATQSRTDYGKPGYGGPCPPVGDKPHRYIFTVYALKTDKLDLPADSSGALVGYYINQNKIAEAKLTAFFAR